MSIDVNPTSEAAVCWYEDVSVFGGDLSTCGQKVGETSSHVLVL